MATLAVIVTCATLFGSCASGLDDAADYCQALRDVMSAAPDYGLGNAVDEELATYLTSLEQAAASAPADQAAALQEYAAALRSVASDPTDDTLNDRLGAALSGMLIVQEFGERECGLDFGADAD